jgi:hypothetical protein
MNFFRSPDGAAVTIALVIVVLIKLEIIAGVSW